MRMSTLGSAVLSSVARPAATFVDHPLDEFFDWRMPKRCSRRRAEGDRHCQGVLVHEYPVRKAI
jgi:hypothetical protein